VGGKLLYRDGNGRDASVDIVPDGAFLGRGADCAVRTDDAMVSRKNCKISLSGGRWIVEDLGSSNGTFVNEVRVQKQALNHADVVRCGTLQVRFVETADTAAPAGGKPRTMSIPAQGGGGGGGASVQVDPALQQAFGGGGGLNPAALMQQKDYELQQAASERDMLAARLREASQELEAAQHRNEGNQQELQRLRAENLGYRDRLGEIQREKSLQDDEIHALTKVGNELREELEALKGEHLTNKQRVEELSDEMSARERQLERAHEDVQRAKQSMEEMRGKMSEVSKTKDEGWKELNARIAELDQLREVINEQERILEERKVGLMSLETAVKDGRAEKERTQREMIQMKNERDELRDKVIRQNHQVEALEEEQRRLARMLSDGGGGGGGGSDTSEHVRLATEVRELKVELRKVETERARFSERLETVERERAQLEEQMSRLDIDRASAVQSKGTIDAARARLEEKLAKTDAARAKAEEALAEAIKGRETASQMADRAKVDADRDRKRAVELELELKVTRESLHGATPEMLAAAAHPQLLDSTSEIAVPAEARVHQLEEEVARLEKELAAHAGAGAGAATGNGQQHVVQLTEIKKKAEEAYSGINDALSELRTNILLAKDLVAEHGKAVPDHDAARTLEDAINVSVDRTEDAKGLLRALREVIES
jgi:pSer/pThr/pTyr-binding forkhead associated (FHA) protein